MKDSFLQKYSHKIDQKRIVKKTNENLSLLKISSVVKRKIKKVMALYSKSNTKSLSTKTRSLSDISISIHIDIDIQIQTIKFLKYDIAQVNFITVLHSHWGEIEELGKFNFIILFIKEFIIQEQIKERINYIFNDCLFLEMCYVFLLCSSFQNVQE